MTRRDWIAAVAFVLMVIGLAACGHQATVPLYQEEQVLLKDGRSVTCIMRSYGGVSCDWEHAK